MTSQYNENNFSTENISTSQTTQQININKKIRPNIDHLIKRIIVERRRERNSTIVLSVFSVSVILVLLFFLN
jgi:hypothetical protein